MIWTKEILPGVIQVTIATAHYGQAGRHWRRVLEGPHHNGYGRIFIQRFGAEQRRTWHCYPHRVWYKGQKGVNQDECPGAMFIWTGDKEADVEALDAIDNQTLGRDLKNVLLPYKQGDENDLWEIVFRFV
jgi:hypothetical protein